MRSHLLKKVLPFALAVLIGAWLAGGVRRGARRACSHVPRVVPAQGEAHERTWLFIHSTPAPAFTAPDQNRATFSVSLRVRLGADGKASIVEFERGGLRADDAAAIEEAVRGISFTPPTEDGRPLDALADVDCGLRVTAMREYIDKRGRKHDFTDVAPGCSIGRVVVEDAREPDGIRVIYE